MNTKGALSALFLFLAIPPCGPRRLLGWPLWLRIPSEVNHYEH